MELKQLAEVPKENFSESHEMRYNQAVHRITTIRQEVKRNLRPIFVRAYEWSPEFSKE